MKRGKMVTYLVVGLLVLYILYLMFKATKLKTKEGCFVFEETHEDDGGDTECGRYRYIYTYKNMCKVTYECLDYE